MMKTPQIIDTMQSMLKDNLFPDAHLERRTIHSKKPDTMYRMIEAVSYPPYLELFARTHRDGWSSIGDQLEGGEQCDLSKYQ